MGSSALILAAHGSRSDSSVNDVVARYARAVEAEGLFDAVVPAFHLGEPAFATVLDVLDADDAVVIPVMTSAGYYSETVLPRELAKNRRASSIRIRQVRPIGTHPEFLSLVVRRIRYLLATFALEARQTTVAIVGHGTARHHHSRSATHEVVDELRRRSVCAELIPAFLDEDPRIDTILDRASGANVVVVPFLISNGPHATEDVPRAVGIDPHGDAVWPLVSRSNGRIVVCDEAVGTDPGIVSLIISIAREHR